MGKFEDAASLDATAQAELVRRGEVQPIELVEAAIERVERLNPALNAVVTPMYEQALAAARASLPAGPFAGVPFLLKDLLASYAGVPMTAGSSSLRDFVPDHDSELVSRLKRAGLVILGKTNTCEFGLLPTTEPRLFGPTRNPWDTTRTPGGSSGGSAAAVAAGLVPMAHANDGGGSIRIPAACCGVFGLKPTRGRVPLGPDSGDLTCGLVVQHGVTRSVRDSAGLLDAISGPALGDPYWAPAPARPFLQEVGVDPGRLRIAFSMVAVLGGPLREDAVRAVRDGVQLCGTLGHEMIEVAPFVDAELVTKAFLTLWAADCARAVEGTARATGRTPNPEQFETLTWALSEIGRRHSATDYLLAWQVLQRFTRDITRYLAEYDAWLTPTISEAPVPLGSFDATPEEPLKGLWRAVEFVPFTALANITGQPAMSVPLFWNGEGLPVGAHFVARYGDEATLFRLAAQLEQARPWAARRPPVAA